MKVGDIFIVKEHAHLMRDGLMVRIVKIKTNQVNYEYIGHERDGEYSQNHSTFKTETIVPTELIKALL
jgi:sporulation protein YlmC with PRC-barrel domain